MAKIGCYDCPFRVFGGYECDGHFAQHVGVGCESEQATERLRDINPDVLAALKKMEEKHLNGKDNH